MTEADKAVELSIKKMCMGASNSTYKVIYYLKLKQTGGATWEKELNVVEESSV